MPDVHSILRIVSKQREVRLDIIEKDYALSYLLAGIASTPGLGDRLALKGGTALRKLYYADYRFSEDLDYSTLTPGAISGIASKMDAAISRMAEMLGQRGPFQVQVELLELREPHPEEQAAYIVRVQFPGQRQPLCRLKVEITVDEPVLLPLESRPILHGFEEPFSATARGYALKEIVAEKLRALLQSRARLADRGWGASRVCRDYYDLWWILKTETHLGEQFPVLFESKRRVRNVEFNSPDDFFDDPLLDVARREWTAQLLPFVPHPPAVEQVLKEIHPLVLALWQ